MSTDIDKLKALLAEQLDTDPASLADNRTLGDLGLDEVDIEELLFAIEEETETADDETASLSLPFLGAESPLTPTSTASELIAYILGKK